MRTSSVLLPKPRGEDEFGDSILSVIYRSASMTPFSKIRKIKNVVSPQHFSNLLFTHMSPLLMDEPLQVPLTYVYYGMVSYTLSNIQTAENIIGTTTFR